VQFSLTFLISAVFTVLSKFRIFCFFWDCIIGALAYNEKDSEIEPGINNMRLRISWQ
jgi:hypothetical protein